MELGFYCSVGCYNRGTPITPAEDLAYSEDFITRPTTFNRVIGEKSYEIKDHLGNVRLLISDIKQPDAQAYNGFKADVLAVNDYYPFGMLQPGRHWQSSSHRCGFNGMEMDNEVKENKSMISGQNTGTGNSYDYGARFYDPRVGRWLSRDPLSTKYPFLSPYAGLANNPVIFKDIGDEDIFLANIPILKAIHKASLYTSYGKQLNELYNEPSSPNYRDFDVYISSYYDSYLSFTKIKKATRGWTSAPLNNSSDVSIKNGIVGAKLGLFDLKKITTPPDEIKFVNFDGLNLQKPASKNQLISIYEDFLSFKEFIFRGINTDNIKKSSDIGSLEVHRFKSLLFIYMHEFYAHVKLSGDGIPSIGQHPSFGNTKSPSTITDMNHNFNDWWNDPALGASRIVAGTPADRIWDEINNINTDILILSAVFSSEKGSLKMSASKIQGNYYWYEYSPDAASRVCTLLLIHLH